MPFGPPRPEKYLLLGIFCFLMGGVVVWFWVEGKPQPVARENLPSDQEQELLLLRSENRLLQSMLGQLDGKVVLLGRASSEIRA